MAVSGQLPVTSALTPEEHYSVCIHENLIGTQRGSVVSDLELNHFIFCESDPGHPHRTDLLTDRCPGSLEQRSSAVRAEDVLWSVCMRDIIMATETCNVNKQIQGGAKQNCEASRFLEGYAVSTGK
jgi:hypothetical protein